MKNKLKNSFLCLMLLCFTSKCGAATSGTADYETKPLVIQTANQNLSLTVEIADTNLKRSHGLMDRQSLDQDKGMLFLFDSETDLSFWMKDTYISLDIIFINSNKEIVYIEQNTIPLSLEKISPNQPCQYVLEVNAGYTQQNNVSIGDKVSF